jgi:hypothetical protein
VRRVVMSWVLAAVCVPVAGGVEPAHRQSNPQVRAVLEYFYSLAGKTDHRIVSGRSGDYFLAKALELDAHDNGLTIETAEAGKATLYGGKRGWPLDQAAILPFK